MVGMIRELFFTIRRFVLSTQGLEKTTQGLEISSPGLEITSRRVVKTNPGLVWGGGRWIYRPYSFYRTAVFLL